MKRLLCALIACVPFAAGTAWAAEITRTLEAFATGNPWDAQVEINYDRSLRRALISRERADPSGADRYVDDKELRYSRIDHTMDFKFRFALYKDLEVYINLPLVLSKSQFGALAQNSGEPGLSRTGGCTGPGQATGDSSIIRDGLFRGGGIASSPDATLPHLDPANPRQANRARTILGQAGVTDSPTCYLGNAGVPTAESVRSGFGDMSIGMAWAPLNHARDETSPTWLLKLEYQLPTGTTQDPTPRDPASGNFSPQNSTAGLGMHALHFSTYFSKRLHTYVDPYVGLEYSAFFPAANPIFRRLSDNQEHVGPGQRAGIVAGMEIVPYENRQRQIKFAIDLRLRARATFEGRDYSEVADFLGRVTDIESYATFDASISFYVQITKWFLARFHLGLAHDTKHFLTFANIGEDRNCNGFVENQPMRRDCGTGGPEQNPTYDPLTDQVGRRLSVSETTVFNWGFSLIAMFSAPLSGAAHTNESNDPLRFREEQRFRQPWMWFFLTLPSLLLIGLGVFALVWQIGLDRPFGARPIEDGALIALSSVMILLGFGVAALFFYMKLVVEVRETGLYVRFAPFHRRPRWFPLDTIAAAEAVKYRPIRDYGGWGIRWGRKGRAYNVSGDRGVQLTLTTGERVLIGSQRASDLAAALARAVE